jgi:hypothetical protein
MAHAGVRVSRYAKAANAPWGAIENLGLEANHIQWRTQQNKLSGDIHEKKHNDRRGY